MSKVVLFFILDNYADWESTYLSTSIQELSNSTVDVKTVSLSLKPVRTIGGFTTLPDYDLKTLPDDFLGLFLIGGTSWKEEKAREVLPLIQKTIEKGKVLGGICAASEFLGANGFLNNIKHTSNGLRSILEWENNLYNNQKGYIHEQAVRDGNIVTANGTGTLEFTREALKALDVADDAIAEENYKFHKIGYCELIK